MSDKKSTGGHAAPDAAALLAEGVRYYQGEGVARDYQAALEKFRLAAESGNPAAQCWLGLCHYRGEGTPKDAHAAYEWFSRSAEQGHANAQYYLGCLYLRGEGVPAKDLEHAVVWLKKAEQAGHPEARKELDRIWSARGSLQPALDDHGGGFFGKVGDKLSQMTGLQPLAGFNLRDLFSEVFRKRKAEEIEEQFAVGTRLTTPDFNSVQANWPKPWVFGPILLLAVSVYFGFSYAFDRFQNWNLIPGWLFIGSVGVPMATLIMIFEMNILKNISAYLVAKLLLAGGLLSIVFSLLLFQETNLDKAWGDIAAGPIEETGKLLAVLILARPSRYPWTINGILLGAAIGTAFSAFESAGYAFRALEGLLGNNATMEGVMMQRAFFAPFGHICWTAITAGAFWRLLSGRKFSFSYLGDWTFLRIALIPVVLHMLWNSNITLPLLDYNLSRVIMEGIICVVGWMLLFMLIQDGIRQIKTAQGGSPTLPAPH